MRKEKLKDSVNDWTGKNSKRKGTYRICWPVTNTEMGSICLKNQADTSRVCILFILSIMCENVEAVQMNLNIKTLKLRLWKHRECTITTTIKTVICIFLYYFYCDTRIWNAVNCTSHGCIISTLQPIIRERNSPRQCLCSSSQFLFYKNPVL